MTDISITCEKLTKSLTYRLPCLHPKRFDDVSTAVEAKTQNLTRKTFDIRLSERIASLLISLLLVRSS